MAQPFPKNDIEDDGNQFLAAAAEKDALVGRRIWRQFAIYHPVVTPMHKGNPYIEALPHNPSREELIKMLEVRLPYSAADRSAPAADRQDMILQIRHFVQPLTTNLMVFDVISTAMKGSYITRNPASPRFLADARRAALELGSNWAQNPVAWRPGAAGSSAAMLAASGVGKTTAIEAALALFPAVSCTPSTGAFLFAECKYFGSSLNVHKTDP